METDTQHLLSDSIPLSSQSQLHTLTSPPIGKPASKKGIGADDIFLACISLACLGSALASVMSNTISWHLGQGANQLIILGFLLSVMNLCLQSAVPTFFLLLEARFGPSTLQNYEGILRNKLTAPKLDIVWRILLGIMVALPVAVSIGYKTFTGGVSYKDVNATTYTANTSYYGMFGPPGLQSIGQKTGLAIFFNATLPFYAATSQTSGEAEPDLPHFPQVYGMNTIMLNENTTAFLDMPQPDYISKAQEALAEGEAWNITAPVFATVSSLNRSSGWNETFQGDCEVMMNSTARWKQELWNGWAVVLVDYPGLGDQSREYIGLPPTTAEEYSTCAGLSRHVYRFDITRQTCQGTWYLTRGSIMLTNGQCNGTLLPSEDQTIFTKNNMDLVDWFLSAMVEVLGPFSTTRNESHWVIPSYSVAMGAMMWARATGLDQTFSVYYPGLIYPVADKVSYIRPTLQKSVALYALLCLQPFLLIMILVLSVFLFSTPVSKGFGLVSILSGLDTSTVDMMRGAALSGELEDKVKLSLTTVQNQDQTNIKYSILSSETRVRNGRLFPKRMYY